MINFHRILCCSLFLSTLTLCSRAQGPTPQLWYWHHSNLTNDAALASNEALVDQAVAAGYTGVAFWDDSFNYITNPIWPTANVSRLQTLMQYAATKGLKVLGLTAPYGLSNQALSSDPNMAEAQRVIGTQYQVDSTGSQLHIVSSFPGLLNGGFESGAVDWFDMGDAGAGVDTTVSHSGIASGHIGAAPFNSRLRQGFTLKPWRQYHLRLWHKAQNLAGAVQLAIFDANDFDKVRLTAVVTTGGYHDWTQVDYTFNSQNTTQAYLYLGIWGGHYGDFWLDDVQLEETGLVYVARRDGAPLTIYDPNNPSTVFREGTDYNYISDPEMAPSSYAFRDIWHAPPVVTLPPGTTLRPGQIVAIDSYSAFVEPAQTGVSLCLTAKGVLNWQTQNAKAVAAIMPTGSGLFMQYDEIRQMDSCQSCRAKNMTPGQLLAWNVGQSLGIYQSVMPGAPLYVWSDMFDPYANAHDNYYYVEGDISGSWAGLPSTVTIMNWNLGNLANSLKWFSGQNPAQPAPHQQIIAGYYDNGDGTGAATSELAQAAGIPGVQGLMYTTWSGDYSQLQNFANAARAGWTNYLNSVGVSAALSVPSGWVNVISKNSNLCLDVVSIPGTNYGKNPAALVQQYTCWGGDMQKWQFTPVEGGYEITSKNSGMQLDVIGGPGATQDGVLIQQWPYWGGTNQIWNVTPTPDGYFSISPQNSGKCLDVIYTAWNNWGLNPGTLVQQWDCWNGPNQEWKIAPAR